ncbi:cytochrome c biogenesis protein CcsA [Motiliproteus sp. SC1-56]|uniref:cytochrome c biogenesis protein CcsA n=1 Tax=Motiliproteus sp. SC1-56 TaxID=2799565 RepID=UPI001A8DAD7A|nr:cytochrome c biogenesis protein CcsA [Motiliproteus sp. SC1-56]
MTVEIELMILWGALVIYVIAGSAAIVSTLFRYDLEDLVLGLMVAGLLTHTAALGYRWIRLEHGPFLTMFEILSSNIWSLTLFFSLCYWRSRAIRPVAAFIMPVLFLMMGWLLLTNPGKGFFPPTYDTVWLYIHIGFGKVFMGGLLVAVGLSLIILLRPLHPFNEAMQRVPGNQSLTELAYRFMALALVFHTLMLVAGAIWAQDAWGRYWDWDPLETWSFLSWLFLALSLHARVTWRMAPQPAAVMVIAVFVVAFLTFYGVPFVSMVPHQGAV